MKTRSLAALAFAGLVAAGVQHPNPHSLLRGRSRPQRDPEPLFPKMKRKRFKSRLSTGRRRTYELSPTTADVARRRMLSAIKVGGRFRILNAHGKPVGARWAIVEFSKDGRDAIARAGDVVKAFRRSITVKEVDAQGDAS